MTSLAFRPAKQCDTPFVIDSWLDSFRNAHAAGLIAMEDWRGVMGPQIAKMLRRPGVVVIVAYRPGEEEGRADLYGWAAVEHRAIHPPLALYVYVKQPYRRLKIATRLLREAGIDPSREWHYAAKTGILTRIAHRLRRARWRPLAVRYPSETPGDTDGRRSDT